MLTCTSDQPNRQHTQGPSPPELWLQFQLVFQWKLRKEKHVKGMTQLSGESSELPPTYCHADSGARHSQAHVIGQGDVNAEHPGVVEELTEDQLTVWGRRGCVADRLHRCDAVGIRNDCANLVWQTEKNKKTCLGILAFCPLFTKRTLLFAVYSFAWAP